MVARLANSSSALLVVVAALSPRLAVAQHAEAEHAWSYEGASGPAKWGDLKSEYTVVAVVFKMGQANPFIEALWKNLPPDVGREHAPEGARMDLNQLLPASHGYYTFSGSLTTPPCSEDVTWFVLKGPVEISKPEVATFAAKYAHNARPVQPINGRAVQATR